MVVYVHYFTTFFKYNIKNNFQVFGWCLSSIYITEELPDDPYIFFIEYFAAFLVFLDDILMWGVFLVYQDFHEVFCGS